MISFKQFIVEAFDNPYKLVDHEDKTTRYNGVEYVKQFDTGDDKFTVLIHKTKSDQAEVMFQSNKHGMEISNSSKHNALRIYATIGLAIKQYLKKYKTNELFFSSARVETNKIYDTLAKRIAKELNGEYSHVGQYYKVRF